MRRTEWWLSWFGTPNGDLSVARLHIGWGVLVLAWYVLLLLGARPDAAAPPSAMFVNGLIVLFVGGIALLLEARIERLPYLKSWPASLAPQPLAPQPLASPPAASETVVVPPVAFETVVASPVASEPAAAEPAAALPAPDGATEGARYWLDIAVLQLVLGAGVVPVLSHLPAPGTVGWRLVAITIASEIVYLAFLGAQLAQKNELDEIFVEIREAKIRIIALAAVNAPRPASEPPAVPETDDEKRKLQAEQAKLKQQAEEAMLKLQAEEERLKLLQDRARVLMRGIGRTLARVKQSG